MSITLLEYFADRADAIHADAFRGIRTLADWQRQRAAPGDSGGSRR